MNTKCGLSGCAFNTKDCAYVWIKTLKATAMMVGKITAIAFTGGTANTIIELAETIGETLEVL